MKLRKLFVCFAVTLAVSASVFLPAAAAPYSAAPAEAGSSVSTRAETTKWYFRTYNGQLQKRLWSLTQKIWLTDWMPV